MRVIDAVIKTLQDLDGEADLEQIYIGVNKYRATPRPSIRARIYEHSKDCDAYNNKNPDIFASSDGKGKGKWSFRKKVISEKVSWLDEIIDMEKFNVGDLYKKKEIRKFSNLSEPSNEREPWTGIVSFANAILLFVNLDKNDAEEEYKYSDFFDNSDFYWSSRNKDTIRTSYIDKILNSVPTYLFCRINKKGDFIYVGSLEALDFNDELKPIQFQFEVLDYKENPNKPLKDLYDWKPSNDYKLPVILQNEIEEKKNRKSSHGYIRDIKKKELIEQYAMNKAYDHYHANGYEVEDCSERRGLGYDYKCSKNSKVLEVEVKGTSLKNGKITLTKNEVDNAVTTNNQSDLFVVRMEILINKNEYSVGDSKNFIFSNWRPKKEDLEPLTYSYEIPTSN